MNIDCKCPTCTKEFKTDCGATTKDYKCKKGIGVVECNLYEEYKSCEECDIEIPTYKYNDKKLCGECLLKVLEKEERIRTWTSTHYEDTRGCNYEYLGNDNDNEFDNIIEIIANRFKIKKLEE